VALIYQVNHTLVILRGTDPIPFVDITIITPVFHQKKIVFFVASRGHHADIGGISPGK
jgi:N-methylhydantoinase B/oxoprolinase/acetone carboxylase alpha subunit